MFQVEINEDSCKGCGLCVSACPKKILALSEARLNKKGFHPAEVIDMAACIGCTSCGIICPDMAIRITKEAE